MSGKVVLIEGKDGAFVHTVLRKEAKSAFIDFSGSFDSGSRPKKSFKEGNGIKAYEQLKRWVSSAAFNEITVVGGLEEFENDKIVEWIYDHKSKEDFPTLFISGEIIGAKLQTCADEILK